MTDLTGIYGNVAFELASENRAVVSLRLETVIHSRHEVFVMEGVLLPIADTLRPIHNSMVGDKP